MSSDEGSSSQKPWRSSSKSGATGESPAGKTVRKIFNEVVQHGNLKKVIKTEDLDRLDSEKLGSMVLDFLRDAAQKSEDSNRSSRSGSRETSYSQPAYSGSKPSNRPKGSSFMKQFSDRTINLVRNASSQSSKAAAILQQQERRNSDSSASAIADMKEEKRQKREIKKRADQRSQNRKDALERIRIIPLDGISEQGLPGYIDPEYKNMLEDPNFDPRVSYLSLLESLRVYYGKQTWPNSEAIEQCAKTFISRHILKSQTSLNSEYLANSEEADRYSDRRIREHKLQIFLELGSVQQDSSEHNEDVIDGVVQKFQIVQIFCDKETVSAFVDGELFDEFLDKIPKTLFGLFDELYRPIPPELEMFAPNAEPEKVVEPPEAPVDVKPEKTKKTKELEPVNGWIERPKKKQKDKKKRHSKKRAQVPDTPDEKQMPPSELRSKQRNSLPVEKFGSIVEDSPIRQSPREHASTIAAKKNKRTARLEKLIINRESQLSRRESFYRSTSFVSAKGNSTPKEREDYLKDLEKSTSTKKKPQKSPAKSPAPKKSKVQKNLGPILESREKSPVRKNLARKFSNPGPNETEKKGGSKRSSRFSSPASDGLADCQVPAPKRMKVAKGKEQPEKKEVLERKIEKFPLEYFIPPEAHETYKNYMQKLRSAKYKGKVQEGEVFYGRGSARCNVFEGCDIPSGKRAVLRSNSDEATKSPKNRSGRKIRTDIPFSHVANYLLNVKNENPTSPVIPKIMALKLRASGSMPRIPKLNRKPSKIRRQRLHKRALEYWRQEEEGASQGALREDPGETSQLEVKVEEKEDRLRLEGLLLSPRNNELFGKNGISHRLRRSSMDCSPPIRRQRSKSDSDHQPLRRSSRMAGSVAELIPERDDEEVRNRLMSWSDGGMKDEDGGHQLLRRRNSRMAGSVAENSWEADDQGRNGDEEDDIGRDEAGFHPEKMEKMILMELQGEEEKSAKDPGHHSPHWGVDIKISIDPKAIEGY